MTTPPGWYPDPQAPPGVLPARRWWDGVRWTEHLAPAAPVVAGPPTSPDGQLLAGWGRRLGAFLLDALILAPFFVLASVPFWGQIGDAITDYWNASERAIDAGTSQPSAFDLQRDLMGTMITIGLTNLAINFVYQVGFLAWKQATPGKLLLGLRVRRREVAGPLPIGTVLARWGTQFGPNVLSGVVGVSYLVSIYGLLDGLWPLWDGKRQALHDKVARTNVVVAREDGSGL